jgi:hypothetical protein
VGGFSEREQLLSVSHGWQTANQLQPGVPLFSSRKLIVCGSGEALYGAI